MASLKYYNKTTNQWEYVSSNSGSSDILIDNTLTQAGQAADAKAVGDALAEKQPKGNYALKSEIPNVSGFLTEIPSEYVTETELSNKGFLTSYTETDPTVPAWAKASTKPTYTKSEVGLGNVDNTSDANKPVSTVQATAIAEAKKAGTDAQANLSTHINNKSNPHGVTASQVGADPTGTANSLVSAHNTATNAHADIRNEIAELAKREEFIFVDSIEECVDTDKIYILPDGSLYTYSDGVKTNYYNESTVSLNTRYSSSSSAYTTYNGLALTDFIETPILKADPFIVTIPKKYTIADNNTNTNTYSAILYFNSNKELIGVLNVSVVPYGSSFKNQYYTINGSDLDLHLGYYGDSVQSPQKNSWYDLIRYVRIGLVVNIEQTVLTDAPNDVYIYLKPYVTEEGVNDTGLSFITRETNDNITALDYNVASHETRISALENDSSTASVPDYWQTKVDEAIASIKAKQDISGNQCVNFAHFSDMHVFDSDDNYCKNIGSITAAVMDACNIPLAVNNGDIMTNDSVSEQYADTYLPSCYDRAWQYMKPIAMEKLMCNSGNHDGAYGYYNNSDVAAYRFNWKPEKLWQYIYRPQIEDFKRVWGDSGKYFYIDNIPQKTRFIMLNSHDGVYSENNDGTAVWSTMKGCYTQEQIDWFTNVALDVQDGWTIVLFSHVPPTAQLPKDYSGIGGYSVIRGVASAYANKTTYSGSYTYNSANGEGAWANSSVSVDFTNANGIIAGWFSGHAHKDAIVTGDLPFPIITTTCAGNFSYDKDNEGTRTLGTATETAVDFISIDKKNKTISIRRLGIGISAERNVSYGKVFTVTNNLTNVTNSNMNTAIAEGDSYTATITSTAGEITSAIITMGGVDITNNVYSDGTITISEVTGNIIITISAEVVETGLPVTWLVGKKCTYAVGSACAITDESTYTISEVIPVEYGKTYKFTIPSATGSSEYFRWVGVDANGNVTESANIGGTPNSAFEWTPTTNTTVGVRLRMATSAYNAKFSSVTELTVS